GLGKTAVMAIWLLARATGAPIPRRLVYIVDRRAVVDQATTVAESLREFISRDGALASALGLDDPERARLGLKGKLPISTLRGQFVDNREWLEDPASPAIVVGTVDMVGSRLLFEGYGTSRKMRPYHAGLLGTDTLVVLDEAHLVPAFEALLTTIAEGAPHFGPRTLEDRQLIPSFHLLTLSATGRTRHESSFELKDEDLAHPIVRRRLKAPKRLTFRRVSETTKLSDALVDALWERTGEGKRNARFIVFANRREDAEAALSSFEKRAKREKQSPRVELFVGARRVFERSEAAHWLEEHGFIAGASTGLDRPAVVFATSAAEVGVDLDADHMICDLVTWERMVQRLGRVNRRGDGDADITVIIGCKEDKKKSSAHDLPEDTLRAPFASLPDAGDGHDVSPGAIRVMQRQARSDELLLKTLNDAITPPSLYPELTRPLVDAWSMTSLDEHAGRPEVDPWLRGWTDDPPRTRLLWRIHLPTHRDGQLVSHEQVEGFLAAAPPHASEVLETETDRVIEWLQNSIKRIEDIRRARSESTELGEDEPVDPTGLVDDRVVAIRPARKRSDSPRLYRLRELREGLLPKPTKDFKNRLRRDLAESTLLLDAAIGGLHRGLLDASQTAVPRAADDGRPWLSYTEEDPASRVERDGRDPTDWQSDRPVVGFRIRAVAADDDDVGLAPQPPWRERHRFPRDVNAEGDVRQWWIVDQWRHDALMEEDRSAGRCQLLDEHHEWAGEQADSLAHRLKIGEPYRTMLVLAARVHDEGKRAERWQRAFHASRCAADSSLCFAKTPGPINQHILDGYRHELGSLPRAGEAIAELPEETRELALHLIASHHGYARPVIGTRGGEAPPSTLDQLAAEVTLRFARMQERWGPWGLAWWEALLRAADQQASRRNEQPRKSN
ncbi:MAG: type I-U CRISPR-associated helicase/endonuclease Cas3, partial [Myxococcota bacterium]